MREFFCDYVNMRIACTKEKKQTLVMNSSSRMIYCIQHFLCCRLKSQLKSVYNQKCDVKKNILDTECLQKEMMEKLRRKVMLC